MQFVTLTSIFNILIYVSDKKQIWQLMQIKIY